MLKRVVSRIVLATLLFSIVALAFKVQPVKAYETIYIRADGSIDPPTAPILQNGDLYTLTGNITSDGDGIVIERSSIVLDGAHHVIEGPAQALNSCGVIMSRNNVTMMNITVTAFDVGVWLNFSSSCTITESIIANNTIGIQLQAERASISSNNITGNFFGIQLTSTNSTVSGNNITYNAAGILFGFGSYPWDGDDADGNRIAENNITANSIGVKVSGGDSNSFLRNNITQNGAGVFLEWASDNNVFSENELVANEETGLWLQGSSYNTITGNEIETNGENGIVLGEQTYNEEVWPSSNDTVTSNSITGNGGAGIWLAGSSYNTITGNGIEANTGSGMVLNWLSFYGKYLHSSSNDIIRNNVVSSGSYAVQISNSSDNRLFHNSFVNNAFQISTEYSMNAWDDGYPSGGNYWSDFAGLDLFGGLYQNESGSDGIGDEPYVLDPDNIDHYPLLQPYNGSVRNMNTGHSYPTIQEAIDSASEGDRLFACSGKYVEHVTVDKGLTLIGESGEAIIHGNGIGEVVQIESGNCRISGFTIRDGDTGVSIHAHGAGEPDPADEFVNITLADNVIMNCLVGINASADLLPTAGESGKISFAAVSNLIINNTCGLGAIRTLYSEADTLIANNFFIQNVDAVVANDSRVKIENNTICYSSSRGIAIGAHELRSTFSIVSNRISGNKYGMTLQGKAAQDGNVTTGVVRNNLIENNEYGVHMWKEQTVNLNCTFHTNNFVGNDVQVYFFGDEPSEYTPPTWDAGYPDGGNYWSDYIGLDLNSGPYQNITGSDGIGDAPFTIDLDNTDHYPLMEPVPMIDFPSPPIALHPLASFAYAPVGPVTNGTISFDASTSSDLDGYVTSYTWFFGDGANATESDPAITHFYTTPGIYNVSLTVTDDDGLDDTTTRLVDVGKYSSSISISGYPSTILFRESILINGTIIPTRADADVAIWYRLDQQGSWKILSNVTTDLNSEYSYTWFPSQTGTHSLKANWTGDAYTFASETPIINVVCMNISAVISITSDPSADLAGYRVNLTGALLDMYGNSMVNETVVLEYSPSGTSSWTMIASVKTDDSGNYLTTWIPPAIGDFVLRAEWAGNSTYSGTSSIITLSSLSYGEQYVFTIESNSTVSALAFNASDWALSFTVSGLDGTNGYAKIAVARPLITNTSNIRVYIGGNQTDFSITTNDDLWLLTFSYTHSIGAVIVDLDIYIVPEYPALVVILLLFTMATAAAFAALRKKGEDAKYTSCHRSR